MEIKRSGHAPSFTTGSGIFRVVAGWNQLSAAVVVGPSCSSESLRPIVAFLPLDTNPYHNNHNNFTITI